MPHSCIGNPEEEPATLRLYFICSNGARTQDIEIYIKSILTSNWFCSIVAII